MEAKIYYLARYLKKLAIMAKVNMCQEYKVSLTNLTYYIYIQ